MFGLGEIDRGGQLSARVSECAMLFAEPLERTRRRFEIATKLAEGRTRLEKYSRRETDAPGIISACVRAGSASSSRLRSTAKSA